MVVLVIGGSVVCLALVVMSAFWAGRGVLRAYGCARAATVSWTGLAVSLLPAIGVATILFAVISTSADNSGGFFETPSLLALIAAAVAEIVAAGIIGALVWWWVAHIVAGRAKTAEIRHRQPL